MIKKLVLLTALATITTTTHTISWTEFWSGVDAFLTGYGTTKAYGPTAGYRSKLTTSSGRYSERISITQAFNNSMAQKYCAVDCAKNASGNCGSCKKILNIQITTFLQNPVIKKACITGCATYTDITKQNACMDICNRE